MRIISSIFDRLDGRPAPLGGIRLGGKLVGPHMLCESCLSAEATHWVHNDMDEWFVCQRCIA